MATQDNPLTNRTLRLYYDQEYSKTTQTRMRTTAPAPKLTKPPCRACNYVVNDATSAMDPSAEHQLFGDWVADVASVQAHQTNTSAERWVEFRNSLPLRLRKIRHHRRSLDGSNVGRSRKQLQNSESLTMICSSKCSLLSPPGFLAWCRLVRWDSNDGKDTVGFVRWDSNDGKDTVDGNVPAIARI
jgi:hypothetical protein